jgi:DNA-binding SARP family transcriptional activator/tetratricopeptide (TPR) repeat protein
MLEISLLGEQRVAVDGSVVAALGAPRPMALVGFLLMHRDAPQRREHIAAQFWPESTDAQARTNLRRELHSLRAGFPQVDSWLTADGGTLLWRLSPDCELDVAAFETAADTAAKARAAGDDVSFRQAAATAVGLYRGELMPALYDDWVVPERDRLRRSCLTLLDELITLERDAGAYGQAIDRARRRIELEPLEEVGYRALLQVQALSGDRAAALQTYHRCVSLLERELGVAPDQATTAEYERLISHSPPEPAATGPAAAPPPIRLTGPARSSRQVRLVGRERELDRLCRRWQEALTGVAGFAVVAGEAGIGKTRLLDELASVVQRSGGDAMRARCFAARGRLALAPVSEWLRSPALRSARGRLDPVWAREVDRLVPPPGADPAAPLRPMADAWQRHRFFEGLARAVLSAGRPVLLVLDDLQWCDEDTLAWLQLLLHLGREDPLLVVASTRLEEAEGNAELTEMLRVLRSAGQVVDVSLTPLDAERSAELAAEVLGTTLARPEADWLYAATGGYPLFVVESVRANVLDHLDRTASSGAWPTAPTAGPAAASGVLTTLARPDPGPQARAVLADRIGQAGPAAREVAELAAVIGRDFTVELLTEASDLDPDVVVGAVDELWRRRIIREHSAASYDFFHDLLRDSAYEVISLPRRRLLHRRVAQAIELVHADDLDTAAAALADQYERAGRQDRAMPYHVRAAQAATAVFANHRAVRHYRRATELLGQTPARRDRDVSELSIRNAMAAPLNAQYGYASAELQDVLERARDLAERLGDTRTQLLSLVGLFGVRFVQGHIAESYEIAKRSLVLSDLHPDVAWQAHFAVAGSASSLARHTEALRHFGQAHELCHDAIPGLVGSRLDVHARAWSAHAHWLVGHDEEALRWCDWAIAHAEELDHPYSLAVALAYAAITHQLRGDVPQTEAYASRVTEICARYEFAYYDNWGVILGGWCRGGQAGADQIRRGLTRLRDQGSMARQPYYLSLLAETLISAGQDDAAGAVLESARSAAAVHDDRWWLPELYRLDARRSRGPAGERLLRRAAELAEEQGAVALLRRATDDLAQR